MYLITEDQFKQLELLVSNIYVTNAGYNEKEMAGLKSLIEKIRNRPARQGKKRCSACPKFQEAKVVEAPPDTAERRYCAVTSRNVCGHYSVCRGFKFWKEFKQEPGKRCYFSTNIAEELSCSSNPDFDGNGFPAVVCKLFPCTKYKELKHRCDLIDLSHRLDEMQSQENNGDGIKPVKTIVDHLAKCNEAAAIEFYHNEGHKIASYAEIDEVIRKGLGL